jgi:hypothetical protein
MLWQAATDNAGTPFFSPGKNKQGKPDGYDPWEKRGELFRLHEDDNEGAVKLLNSVGFFDMPELALQLLSLAMEKGSKQELVDRMLRAARRHDWLKGEDGWHGVRPEAATPIPARFFWEFRREMLAEMKPKPSETFTQRDYSARFAGLIRLGPSTVITTLTFKDAVAATIRIDQLQKAKFKNCLRPDCQGRFAAVGSRPLKFCSWYCGHIEQVRKSRRAK